MSLEGWKDRIKESRDECEQLWNLAEEWKPKNACNPRHVWDDARQVALEAETRRTNLLLEFIAHRVS